METVRLVSTADNLVVWNLGEIEKLYSEPGTGFRSSSWNYDGTCVASCQRDSDQIILTFVKKNVCTSAQLKVPHGNVMAVQFPRTTVKLLTLATANRVLFFDIAKQKVRQEFKNLDNVNCLTLNQTDKYIAAGCAGGKTFILNTVTGRPAYKDPLVASRDVSVTAVKFNILKQSLLGTSSDEGAVSFWDVNHAKITAVFNEHKAPCTGLAFSPVNEVLALSAGG